MKTLEGHQSSVLKIQYLSLDLQLLSVGADGLLKIWNMHKDTCINTIDNHSGKAWSLDTSSDGRYLLTGGNDSLLHLYVDFTEEQNLINAEKSHK